MGASKKPRYRHVSKIIKHYDTPDLSVRQYVLRVLNNGPEMIGTTILTRSEAYQILWQLIFNWLAKENRHRIA